MFWEFILQSEKDEFVQAMSKGRPVLGRLNLQDRVMCQIAVAEHLHGIHLAPFGGICRLQFANSLDNFLDRFGIVDGFLHGVKVTIFDF